MDKLIAQLNIKLTEDLETRLEVAAKAAGKSKSQYARHVLQLWLREPAPC